MIHPPYIRNGDKIAIVSPARGVTFEEIFPAMKLFQKWGVEVVLGTQVFNHFNQFSGTDEQRYHDLQKMLDDRSIRAIIATRGGYGTVRIVDRLDFTRFVASPKWIVGFSDLTVLHAHVQRQVGVETLHALMPYTIKMSDSADVSCESLRKALFGEKIFYRKPITFYDQTGLTEGLLTGGNLSILVNLIGTPSDVDTRDKILFLEDVDEYHYHVDRMMMQMKRAGKLTHIRGLIVGGLTGMKDNAIPFGKTPQEIVLEAVKEYAYPVCFDFPAGHGEKNVALYLGRKARLIVDEEVSLEFIPSEPANK